MKAYQVLVLVAINVFFGLIFIIVFSHNSSKECPPCPEPKPIGHRYLQRCPGEGLTVEYRSIRKLPEAVVCGE
jgi:hypothetical protein